MNSGPTAVLEEEHRHIQKVVGERRYAHQA